VLFVVAVWLTLIGPSGARASVSLAQPESDLAPGWVLVKPRDGAEILPALTARTLVGVLDVESLPRLGLFRLRVPPGSENEVVQRLTNSPQIEYAETERIIRLSATPNDLLYPTYQWNLPKINAPLAWDVTTGSASVLVAVVDSGFDVAHPDGPANLHPGCDYVRWRAVSYNGVCPAVSDDPNGHGTHVAGIVAARQNNALGITGLAPGVSLMVIRSADANGSSYMSDVAEAIVEAADAQARVINLSLGGPTPSTTLRRAVDDALARGIVVVAAAGNDYESGNATMYPAGFPGVLAVGAVTADDQHAVYSNTGPYVGIVAPVGNGSDVLPTSFITSLFPLTMGGYALMVGTSQAAPQVAAAAGLVLSLRPTLGGAEVTTLLRATAHPLGSEVPNPTFGYGRLDVRAALDAAASGVVPPPPTAVTPTPTPQPTPAAGSPPGQGVSTTPPGAHRLHLPFAPRAATP
jgi:subtilisin family serine protease